MNRVIRSILALATILILSAIALPVYAAKAPVIINQPSNLNFPESSVASWSVEANGVGLQYHWYIIFDGKTYDTQKSYEENKAWAGYAIEGYGPDEEGNVFYINGILPEISGAQIYCDVSTAGGTVSSRAAYISVIEAGKSMPPEIIVQASFTTEPDSVLDIFCYADDPKDGTLSYMWYETSSGKLEDIIAINRGEETDSTLQCDTGKIGTRYYVCMVTTSKGGSGYSSVIEVNVAERKVIIPVITTTSLPDAVVGEYYSIKLGSNDETAEFALYNDPDKINQMDDTGLDLNTEG